MKREDVLKLFPEATDEQITDLLNQNNSEVVKEKEKSKASKEELDRLREIESELEAEKLKNMSAEEKLTAAESAANEKASEYAKKLNRLDAETILLESGLTKEDYMEFIDGIISEDAEVTKKLATSLAGTFKTKSESALQKAKQELLDAGDAGDEGGTGGTGGDEKTEDVKFAEEIAGTFNSNSETSKTVFENY